MTRLSIAGNRAASWALMGAALAVLSGCPRKVRIKQTADAPTQSVGEEAAKALVKYVPPTLPAPTMESREIRGHLWTIAARQRRGEAGKAMGDYAERHAASKTLETQFLAAAAIPDLEAQWNALHDLTTSQPKFYWGHVQKAVIYAQWKVRDQGERELELADNLLPGLAYTETVRGQLYRALGDDEKAVQSYLAALRLEPNDADARVGLALARKAMNQTTNFEAELTKALVDVPTQYEAAEALAMLVDEQGRANDAKVAWSRVADLMPKNRSARLALARLAGDQDPASAISAYEQAAKIQALTKGETQALARLYRQVTRTDDELKTLQALTKLDGKDLAPWRRMAEIYEEKGDLPSVETSLNAIRVVDPKDAPALMGLGKVSEKKLRWRQAIELYREAATSMPAAVAEIQRLKALCMVPAKPAGGATVTLFYRSVVEPLEKMYAKRLEEAPALKGSLRVKIVLDDAGKAGSIDIVENTTSDPYLDANLYYTLLEATYFKQKPGDRKNFTLKFDLPPEKN